jgi:hypothetical protein
MASHIYRNLVNAKYRDHDVFMQVDPEWRVETESHTRRGAISDAAVLAHGSSRVWTTQYTWTILVLIINMTSLVYRNLINAQYHDRREFLQRVDVEWAVETELNTRLGAISGATDPLGDSRAQSIEYSWTRTLLFLMVNMVSHVYHNLYQDHREFMQWADGEWSVDQDVS